MRETIKGFAVIAATCAVITLVIFGAIWLFGWWLFTGVFLETDAKMMEIPKLPLIFAQYSRHGVYSGYLRGYDEDMEYNEYYYWDNVSFAEQPNYQPVAREKMSEILSFVQDYEKQLDDLKGRSDADADRLCREYRYDMDSLTEGDYYRVDVWDETKPFDNYRLYIFDHETTTLYYMFYRQV